MASRQEGKTLTDEETIEWDLTEFAIEESMVKRRFDFATLTKLSSLFEH